MPTDNFITLYEEYTEPLDAPDHYHPFIAHGLLGCAAGKRVWIPGWGSRPIYPNLFMLFLGASGRARKTTSIEIGTKLLDDISVPEIIGTASPESIRDELDPDKGVTEPDAWFHIEEFGRILKMARKDYARDLNEFYCALYDGSVKGRTKKGGRVLRKDLAVTVFTACPQQTIEELLVEGDWSTGFIPRFMIIPPPATYPPIQYDRIQLDRLKHDELIAHLSKLRTMKPHEAKVMPEANAVIIDACRDMNHRVDSGKISDTLWPSICRLQEATWRFALSSACADLSIHHPMNEQPKITVKFEDAKIATQRVNWLVNNLAELVSGLAMNPGAAAIRRVEEYIETAGERTRREVSKKFRTINQRDLDDILNRLASEGSVEILAKHGRRGPGTKVYRYCQNGKENVVPDGPDGLP